MKMMKRDNNNDSMSNATFIHLQENHQYTKDKIVKTKEQHNIIHRR